MPSSEGRRKVVRIEGVKKLSTRVCLPVRNLLCSELLLLLALLFGCFPLVSGVGGGGGSSYEPKESIGYSNVVERAESLNCSES